MSQRDISFGGVLWQPTETGKDYPKKQGPGPNFFSAENSQLLHYELVLSTTLHDGKAYCSQVVTEKPLGYGTYSYTISAGLDSLDPLTIFSGFLYEDDANEIDIEFTKAFIGSKGMQYVVQPWYKLSHLYRASLPPTEKSTHKIVWNPEYVEFFSYDDKMEQVSSWKYNKKYSIDPRKAVFIFNLWLYKGKTPHKEDCVRVSSFTFEPFTS